MSTKPSIHKTKFKKLLKELMREGNLYYKENDFIAGDRVHISLQHIENIDELKPTIVEVFGHLEGDWIWSKKDKNVYDYKAANAAIRYISPLDHDIKTSQIILTSFKYNDKVVFDDLTLIPEIMLLHDYVHFRKEDGTRRIVVTDGTDEVPQMIIDYTLHLTGNDIVPIFMENLVNADYEDEVSEVGEEDDEEE